MNQFWSGFTAVLGALTLIFGFVTLLMATCEPSSGPKFVLGCMAGGATAILIIACVGALRL